MISSAKARMMLSLTSSSKAWVSSRAGTVNTMTSFLRFCHGSNTRGITSILAPFSSAHTVSCRPTNALSSQRMGRKRYMIGGIPRLLSTSTPAPPPPLDEKKEKDDIGGDKESFMSKVREVGPGVIVSAAVMDFGFIAADYLGHNLLSLQGITDSNVASPISGIPVSILCGMILNNTLGICERLEAGIKFSTKPILQAGIICVGAKLSAVDLASAGLVGLPAVCASIGVGMTFIPWLGRKMGLPTKMSSLISIGTSICGVTAITALAPAIGASRRDASFAVANVVAFGTLGMLTYPYLAHALLESGHQIGLFLGLAVHDTSQVLGTALTYSAVYGDEEVLKVATVTKLTRNLFLAGAVPYLTYVTAKSEEVAAAVAAGADKQLSSPSSSLPSLAEVKKYFPGFVAGFMGMSALRTVGDVTLASHGAALGFMDAEMWKAATNLVGNEIGSHYLLGTAMAAVGLSTSMEALKGVGVKPFVVGLAGAGAVGATGFTSAMLLGHMFGV